jgi:mono/diheme cytochrome c family protein
VIVLSLILFAALMIAGGIDAKRRGSSEPDSATVAAMASPQLERGRQAFLKYSCNACHGTAGRGGVKNLNAETGGEVNGLLRVSETYTPEELAQKIQAGVPEVGKADPTGVEPPLRMPPYRDLLGGQELRDLVAYLRSLGSKAAKSDSTAW